MAGEMTFTPTPEDAIAVARGTFTRSLRKRGFLLRVVLVVIFGAGVGAFVTDADRIVTMYFGAGALVWLLLLIAIQYFFVPRRAARLFRQQRSGSRVIKMMWDAEALSLTSDRGGLRKPWPEFHEWFETAAVFAFGHNERLFEYAPKRVMSADQILDLRTTARAIDAVEPAP